VRQAVSAQRSALSIQHSAFIIQLERSAEVPQRAAEQEAKRMLAALIQKAERRLLIAESSLPEDLKHPRLWVVG